MVSSKKSILICLIHNMGNRHLTIPTGAAYISAVLKRDMFNVRNFVWDLSCGDHQNIERLKETISRFDIDVVMCGGMVFDFRVLKLLFESAKNCSSSIITVQGGCFVTHSPVESMKLIPECDLGVLGEGEITTCELMSAIEGGGAINGVTGIVYRGDHDEPVFSEKRAEKPDLDTLPIPDVEGFFGDWLTGHEAYMVTSGRSCNHSCTFCARLDGKYRERPLEKVMEELDYYLPKYSIKGIRILNEYFNVEENYLNAFCGRIKSYGVPIIIQTRVSQGLSLGVLKKLRDSGVSEITLGLESADDSVLESMRKGISSGLMLKVLRDVKAARIHTYGSFIFGDTAEDSETIMRTLDFVREHRDLLNSVSFVMIRLCPGSALFEKAVAEGKIDPMTHIVNQCPPVNVSKLSDDEYSYYSNHYFAFFNTSFLETDLNVENISVRRAPKTGSFVFGYECVSCGKHHERLVECQKLRFIDFKSFCECGEMLGVDYFFHILDRSSILDAVGSDKTAFYGMGRVFCKLYYKCGLSGIDNENIILIDGGLALAWSGGDRHLKVHPPEAINELGVERVILTMSGEYDLDRIITDLRKEYPNTEFTMWYDYASE